MQYGKNDEAAKRAGWQGAGEIGSEPFSNRRKKTELRDQRQKYLSLQAGGRKKHRSPFPVLRERLRRCQLAPFRPTPGGHSRRGGQELPAGEKNQLEKVKAEHAVPALPRTAGLTWEGPREEGWGPEVASHQQIVGINRF